MKILCVCEEGLNRSVTAKWLLQYRDHDVIAVGVKRMSDDTLNMLYRWADLVVLLDRRFLEQMPTDKTVVWDVGPDVFPRPFNRDLVRLIRAYAQKYPWPN